jgi:hypothetical protein
MWNGAFNLGEFGLAGTYILAHSGTPPPPNGVKKECASSNMVITPNMWNGSPNPCEFGLFGSSLTTN